MFAQEVRVAKDVVDPDGKAAKRVPAVLGIGENDAGKLPLG